ncbi:uncharacterized protein LOC125232738 [Leguminivora glycinivorella]|uniref:uncharacterized protein LOC125232738 n=1 Tax=Leguminivora glycinivorella TaxID=1035111 RepID=UPI00200E64A4|nr:uncharacterized protein LOC125232738 [Leguminivora glycinivorella]
MNVATLAYDRRIRGVYQATLLSIASAWLHTICWILSTLLIVARVLLAVDFTLVHVRAQLIASAWLHTICWILSTLLIVARVLLAVDFTLVHVRAQLIGNMDDILQRHERQIHSFNAEGTKPYKTDIDEEDSEEELFVTTNAKGYEQTVPQLLVLASDSKVGDFDIPQTFSSSLSLVPEERVRLLEMYIRELLNDILKNIGKPFSAMTPTKTKGLKTQKAILPRDKEVENAKALAKELTHKLQENLKKEFDAIERQIKFNLEPKDITRDTGLEIVSGESDSSGDTDKIKQNEKSANETKETNKPMPMKRSYVRFNVDKARRIHEHLDLDPNYSKNDDNAANKDEKSNKDDSKNEENEQSESKDKDKSRQNRDDDDSSASKKESTSKDQK